MYSFLMINLFRMVYDMIVSDSIVEKFVPCYVALWFGQELPKNISGKWLN